MSEVLLEYEHLFPDIPSRTDKIYYDVEPFDGLKPVKLHPYRMNPVKQQILRKEVQFLLDNAVIEPSQSEWSSHCILLPKPDWTFRMCTDYPKVNSFTKTYLAKRSSLFELIIVRSLLKSLRPYLKVLQFS